MKRGDVVRVIAGFGDYYDHTDVRVHGVGLIVSEYKNIKHEVQVLINGTVYHVHECYLEVISKINDVSS